ncbi:MAG TPA: nitroreductase family deazaflavin-dependent oxidoreductase [Solirubrobacteraceae bacterium]|jgi:deazaflavin-dependent oxidoreductase (nitroreductase family)|nr:nitroreductase family deazaflavin-dependent oxidoreductase [Solirubrobacteraceae bacterium]
MLFGQEHIDKYRATDGEEGHDWQGTQTLILTTTGRKSGQTRDSALIYGQHGDDYLIVASKGGADQPPAWWLNLEANPAADIQVKGERFAVKARNASPEEKPELWTLMTAEWPAYDEYQTKTDRQIPVVILTPA